MKILRRLLDFYIHSSIHVALAVYSLVRITENTLLFHYNENIAYVVFYGTIVGYNFLKYFKSFQNRSIVIKQHPALIGITLLSAGATFFYFFRLPTSAQLFLIWIFCLVVIYPLLRKQGWLKLFLVSICMAEITVHFPAILNQVKDVELFLLVFQRFLIVFALLIPFEISDSDKDDKNLRTIPQRIGIWNTKRLGFMAILFFLGIEFLKPTYDSISLLIGLISALAILFSSTNRNKYYTSFWVEFIPILWYLFYLILI